VTERGSASESEREQSERCSQEQKFSETLAKEVVEDTIFDGLEMASSRALG
jgi:hypothetical protein